MPRASRAAAGGFCYQVLNRGNARAEVFHKDGDYDAFVQIIAEASLRIPMRVLAYCLIPNHFHLALWPANDGSGSVPRRVAPGDCSGLTHHFLLGFLGFSWKI